MLNALKLYCWVLVTAMLVCVPGALYYSSWMVPRVPFWYYVLSALASAIGMALMASVVGALVLVARRDRPAHRLKPAVYASAAAGLFVSYFAIYPLLRG